MRKVGGGVVALFAVAVLGPAGAEAATVTVGQTDSVSVTCSAASQHVQMATAGGVSYRAPSAGTVTSWSHHANGVGGSGKLIVWRPTGNPNEFLVVDKTAGETFAPGVLNTFQSSLQIAAGDYIGMRNTVDAGCLTLTGNPADLLWHTPGGAVDPGIGSTFTFLAPIGNELANVSATIQTADPPPPPPPAPMRSVTIAYKKNKAFKGVVSSSSAACVSATVEVLRRKGGPDKRIGEDATDAGGRWKVSEPDAAKGKYYASVAAAATCPAARSKNAKVK